LRVVQLAAAIEVDGRVAREGAEAGDLLPIHRVPRELPHRARGFRWLALVGGLVCLRRGRPDGLACGGDDGAHRGGDVLQVVVDRHRHGSIVAEPWRHQRSIFRKRSIIAFTCSGTSSWWKWPAPNVTPYCRDGLSASSRDASLSPPGSESRMSVGVVSRHRAPMPFQLRTPRSCASAVGRGTEHIASVTRAW